MDSDRLNRWLALGANFGVLVGILLLVVELRQISELVRAEIHAIRAESKADRQIGVANSGEVARISAKLIAEGFPANPDAMSTLTIEEQFRLSQWLMWHLCVSFFGFVTLVYKFRSKS